MSLLLHVVAVSFAPFSIVYAKAKVSYLFSRETYDIR